MSEKVQLELQLALPDMEAEDECVHLPTERLGTRCGIDKAHVVRDDDGAKLRLHIDSNLRWSTPDKIEQQLLSEKIQCDDIRRSKWDARANTARPTNTRRRRKHKPAVTLAIRCNGAPARRHFSTAFSTPIFTASIGDM